MSEIPFSKKTFSLIVNFFFGANVIFLYDLDGNIELVEFGSVNVNKGMNIIFSEYVLRIQFRNKFTYL